LRGAESCIERERCPSSAINQERPLRKCARPCGSPARSRHQSIGADIRVFADSFSAEITDRSPWRRFPGTGIAPRKLPYTFAGLVMFAGEAVISRAAPACE